MRHNLRWILVGCVAFLGCGPTPPVNRSYTQQEIAQLHALLGQPAEIVDMSSTSEAQLDAIDKEKLQTMLATPEGLNQALDLLATETPDVQLSLRQHADHRVMLPEVEAILGKSAGVKAERPGDFEIRWQQFGWIEIGMIYGGEKKGDTSENVGFIRVSPRGYKDSRK